MSHVANHCYFAEDECSQSQACAGKVMGFLSHLRDKALLPPSFDHRNIVDLINKNRDAHIGDSGWSRGMV